MKRIVIFIAVGVILLSGCTSEKLSEEAYNEAGEAFADLFVKYQRKNQVTQETTNTDKTMAEDSISESTGGVTDPQQEQLLGTGQLQSQEALGLHITVIGAEVIEEEFKVATDEEVYAYLEATPDMGFLKISLKISNTNVETMVFEDWLNKSQVKLLVTDRYLYTPIPTLLMNDLTSQMMEVKQGEAIEGYFAFMMPKSVLNSSKRVQLIITNGEGSYMLDVNLINDMI